MKMICSNTAPPICDLTVLTSLRHLTSKLVMKFSVDLSRSASFATIYHPCLNDDKIIPFRGVGELTAGVHL